MIADEPRSVLFHLCRGCVVLRELTHTNLFEIRAMDLQQHDVVAESGRGTRLRCQRARARRDEQQQRGNGMRPHVISCPKVWWAYPKTR